LIRLPAVLAALLLSAPAASGGAWTLEHGQVQIFSGTTLSRAGRRFDDQGEPSQKVVFDKLLVQSRMEYGLSDAVTLFAVPEYVTAENGSVAGVTHSKGVAVEAGLRILLLSRIGMLSLQTSGKTAGAYNMSVSAGGAAGRQWELRLLYGKSFKLMRCDAFIDVEAAQRWIERPRPDERVFDATAGLWLDANNLLMLQSFNTVAGEGAMPPYQDYRLHKLQASLVQRLTRRWSLQAGYFFAPYGRNIVKETGFVTTVWFQT
jgi:hypothetical protein